MRASNTIIAALILLTTVGHSQRKSPPAADLDVKAAWAMVRKQLDRDPEAAGFRLELLVDPVRPPSSSPNTQQGQQSNVALPMALFGVFRSEELVGYHQVAFAPDGSPGVSYSVALWKNNNESMSLLPITRRERARLTSALSIFFEAFVDATGPLNRFTPFLSPDIQCGIFNSGERQRGVLSEQACAELLLQAFSTNLWSALTGEEYPLRALFADGFPLSAEQVQTARNNVAAAHRNLQAGWLRTRPRGDVIKYLRLAMGADRIVRCTKDAVNGKLIMPDKTLYTLAGSLPLIFEERAGRIRLCGIMIAGG